MFEKTFESLLKGADAKSDPKTVFSHARKIDYHSRGMQYYNAEKEFMQLASDVGAQMQSNVSQLGLTKNHLQPFLNDVFLRKPKRQVDKSALNEEARTGFVDLFTRMNAFWDNSECKKNATTLFDIKGEGEKDGHGAEGRANANRENRKNLLLRVVSKDSTNDDAISPIYDPSKSPFRKSFVGTNLTVEAYKGGRISGEPTPILNKEDSLDSSANFHAFKPPQSLTQIVASRDTLDDNEHKEEDRQEKLEKILKDKSEKENKAKVKEADGEKEKEAEKEKREEEITKKKAEVWMNAIPDFSYLFSQEIVEPKSTS